MLNNNNYGREQLKKLMHNAWEKGMTAEEFLQMIEKDSDKWYAGLTAELVIDYLKEKDLL